MQQSNPYNTRTTTKRIKSPEHKQGLKYRTKSDYRLHSRLSCKSRDIIYLLECKKCNNKPYVGKTEIPANERINGHRSDGKKRDTIEVDTHFLQPGHNFDCQAKFTLIEQVTSTNLSNRTSNKHQPIQ